MDKLLYNIMFKEASIVPKGSCTEVERAVAGMRSVEGMHDIRAFGIIDNDGKGQSIVDALRKSLYMRFPCFPWSRFITIQKYWNSLWVEE